MGHHSLIINILNDSFLEDLNSTNGTYVNGKLIKKHALQHGDVITVGHHQLRFVEDDEAPGRIRKDDGHPALAAPGREKIQAAKDRRGKGGSATFRERHAQGPRRQTPVKKARLQVLSGAFAGRELELIKALTTLGRPGIQVAAITRRADGFYIVHVEADTPDNYPLVNGTPSAPGAPAGRQRRDPARWREDGVLRELRAGRHSAGNRLLLREGLAAQGTQLPQSLAACSSSCKAAKLRQPEATFRAMSRSETSWHTQTIMAMMIMRMVLVSKRYPLRLAVLGSC